MKNPKERRPVTISANEQTTHNSNHRQRRGPMGHGPMGGPMGGGSGEKAKNFKGTLKKLLAYIGRYKFALLVVVLCAIASTVFTIVGPTILGNATTEIFKGLVSKVSGGAGIDFGAIGKIMVTLMILYGVSALFSFIQGLTMTQVSQKITFRMRKELTDKFHRMPMNYFDTQTHGEILSRVTNDVDTVSMSLNQSITQVITSVTSIIGVLIMMLPHQCANDHCSTAHCAGVHGLCHDDRQALPEIFPETAVLSW